MNTLSYRGYLARVNFGDEDNLLVGKIVGIEDGVTFHTDNVADLSSAFHEAVETISKLAPRSASRRSIHIPGA